MIGNFKRTGTTRFGWCMDGHHDDCPAKYVASVTKEEQICGCACHEEK
jgi:hypothetical protein